MPPLVCHRLGRVEYEDGLTLMRRFVEARATGQVNDTLFLLEHPPVLTLGRGGKRQNVLASEEVLARERVELFETDRGGDVTYHGPGQLVGYPVLHLPPHRQDVRRYVRDIEEALIRALARFGVLGVRAPQWPGVWVETSGGLAKVAAIGVHLSRWYTRHGFALNVNTQLSHFELIVPCGIHEAGVTSMQRLLGQEVSLADVERAVAESFAHLFGAQLSFAPRPTPTVSVTVVRPGPQVLLLQRTQARGGFWQTVTGRVKEGEAPIEAAARELFEETGARAKVRDLGYRHAFAWGDESPPHLLEEHAFATQWPQGAPVRLDVGEHQTFEWVDVGEATRRLPFKGLRRAVSLSLWERDGVRGVNS
ncbi:MAG: lipoyl(octanoyl) transferase LipB [Myxococcota bacterium]